MVNRTRGRRSGQASIGNSKSSYPVSVGSSMSPWHFVELEFHLRQLLRPSTFFILVLVQLVNFAANTAHFLSRFLQALPSFSTTLVLQNGSFSWWCRTFPIGPVQANGFSSSTCSATAATAPTHVVRSHSTCSTGPSSGSSLTRTWSVRSNGQHCSVSLSWSRTRPN